MPISHDLYGQPSKAFVPHGGTTDAMETRRQSEESIRTVDCDWPIPEILMSASPKKQEIGASSNENRKEHVCTDRAELIERIKRGESPTWMPNPTLKQEYLRLNSESPPKDIPKSVEPHKSSPLLPAAELRDSTQVRSAASINSSCDYTLLERPRSALHAGDFTSVQQIPRGSNNHSGSLDDGPLGTSPTTPWYTPSSSFHNLEDSRSSSPQHTSPSGASRRSWRIRAPSLNSYHSSSYVLKPPTTPLVQQSNNTDLDSPPRDRSLSPEKNGRRHTLPPHAFHDIPSNRQWSSSISAARPSPAHRKEASFPYGHRPRRSLTSNWSLQASSSPQTPPSFRSRRTSFNSESSPLQHASMVGSYEESILRGWMSTAPSKPLDFTAQIGVLGRGTCKPKCPPHVIIPFPAVYYSWSAGNGRSAVNDDPSPYVGHIDLQRLAEPAEPKSEFVVNTKPDSDTTAHPDPLDVAKNLQTRKSKKRRHAPPSCTPEGGSYRIPQQGQLQIIIKNPNKTAVKLFLVPYDLEGMKPGTKTFIRQRSYSAETIGDKSPIQYSSLESTSLVKKPTLRYLIHLKICSPARGRFYLYSQIRVVFANRVPDNKEQLRNEIQLPQPRFSAYKSNREPLMDPSSSAGAKLAVDKANRRRSSGFGFGFERSQLDSEEPQTFASGSTFPLNSGLVSPVPAIPRNVTVSRQKPQRSNRIVDDVDAIEVDTSRPTTADDAQSPSSENSSRLIGVQLSSSYKSSSSQGSDGYSKLSKGKSGYGGLFGRARTPEPGEGLLARRLKGLGVQRESKGTEDEM